MLGPQATAPKPTPSHMPRWYEKQHQLTDNSRSRKGRLDLEPMALAPDAELSQRLVQRGTALP